MQELIISPYWLAAIFLFVATAYSSVGLGGGSSYTALLAIFGASHRAIAPVSLTLNVAVTLMGSINFIRGGHARPRLIAIFVCTSMPMAYLGGSLDVDPSVFHWLLIAVLALVVARIYLWRRPALTMELTGWLRLIVASAVGAVLGFFSGIVGIGGGILLVPLIILLGLGDQKEAAAAGAIFVLLNSLAGLGAHAQRYMPDLVDLLPLVGAVLIGGFVGSYLSSSRLDHTVVQRVLGVILILAVILLVMRQF